MCLDNVKHKPERGLVPCPCQMPSLSVVGMSSASHNGQPQRASARAYYYSYGVVIGALLILQGIPSARLQTQVSMTNVSVSDSVSVGDSVNSGGNHNATPSTSTSTTLTTSPTTSTATSTTTSTTTMLSQGE